MARLVHPDLAAVIDVPETSVPALARSGWRPPGAPRRNPSPPPVDEPTVSEGDANPTPHKED